MRRTILFDKLFVGMFFLTWLALNFVIGLHVLFLGRVQDFLYFVVIQIIHIGLAYDFVVLICATFLPELTPSKLPQLERSPTVALLYLCCDDAMSVALSRLNNQTYKNYDVYVLDDSIDEVNQLMVDSFGYSTIRRGHRRGAKAGNLNHWLAQFGEQYEYFVVLDNDCILKPSFLIEMLKYAEHPDNNTTAIFQSVKRAWNTRQLFPRWLDAMNAYQAIIDLQVFNRCHSLFATTNMMCRTQPLQEIGGFNENIVTEDFATSVTLIEQGYQCQAVNVVSYYATSETVQIHTRRMTRWARGTLETAVSKSWAVPLATKLRMFMSVYSFSLWFFYLISMLFVVWIYRVTWNQLYITMFFAFRWQQPDIIIRPLALILAYALYGFIIRPLLVTRLAAVSWKIYWSHAILNMSIGFYAAFDLFIGQLSSLIGRKAKFTTGDKRWFQSSFWHIVSGMKWTIIIMILIAIGLVQNPVGRFVYLPWYLPLFFSPWVIYRAQNAHTEYMDNHQPSLPKTFQEIKSET
ncbi:MAG: glycosyltransferase [Chloroflexi bacterium]|nr:glycosyltransferase [Chloroflexota bacterium]